MIDLFGAFGEVDWARSASDILAGRVRVTLGGTTYTLPVRSVRANREWIEGLDQRLAGVLAGLTAGADSHSILMALASAPQRIAEGLVDYDFTNVLGTADHLLDIATEMELVRAVAEVWLAANPLLVIAAQNALATADPQTSGSSQPTNSSPPSTGGRRKKSKKG